VFFSCTENSLLCTENVFGGYDEVIVRKRIAENAREKQKYRERTRLSAKFENEIAGSGRTSVSDGRRVQCGGRGRTNRQSVKTSKTAHEIMNVRNAWRVQ
jgi:hypothetical protein